MLTLSGKLIVSLYLVLVSIHHKSVLLMWLRVTDYILHTVPPCGGRGFIFTEPFDPRKEDNHTSDVLLFFKRDTVFDGLESQSHSLGAW